MPVARSNRPRVATKKAIARPKARKVSYQTRPYVRGRGGYYVAGGLHASGKMGPFSGGAALHAGYSKGEVSIPTVKGLGAYDLSKIRHNTLLMGDPPIIKNLKSREGAVVFRHREYIGDIVSSSVANTFSVQSFPINPGMSQAFPWLSNIASSFEEYILNGCLFEFKSTASDAIASSTNLALGEVVMATQYDPLNPAFNSLNQMLNYEYAQCCKVSESALHMIECAKNQTPISQLYVRSGSVPGNADLRLYDHGTFYIATNGLQGTSVNVGQLWVTYEILCFKPKIPTSEPYAANYFKSQSVAGTVAQNTPLGTSWVVPPGNLNTLAVVLTSTTMTLPATQGLVSYLISLNFNSLTAQVAAFNNFTFSNCKRINAWGPAFLGNTDVAPQATLAGATSMSICFIVSTTVPLAAAVITLANNVAYAGASNYVDIVVSEIPYMDPNVYGSG